MTLAVNHRTFQLPPDLTLLTGATLAAGSLISIPALAPIVAPTALGIPLLALLVHLASRTNPDGRRFLIAWTAGALLVHLAFALLIETVVHYVPDDVPMYDSTAKGIVAHWAYGSPLPEMLPGKAGFFYTLAAIYRLFGQHTESLLAVNAVLAAGLVPLMSDVTARLFGSRAARDVCPLLILTPGILIWTALPLREASVLFLLAVIANTGVRLIQHPRGPSILIFLATAATLYTFRPGVALTAVAGITGGGVLATVHRANGSPACAAVACMLLVLAVLAGGSGLAALTNAGLEKINNVRAIDSATSTSGIATESDISTRGKALTLVATRLPESLLGPFPWQLRNERHLFALPDVVVGWCFLPLLYLGVRGAVRVPGRQYLALLLAAILTQVMLCLIIGDFGTLLRQRPQVMLFLLPFVAFGFAQWRGDGQPEVQPLASPLER